MTNNCRPSVHNKVAKLDRRKVDLGWVSRGDSEFGQPCELLERTSRAALVGLLYESPPKSLL